MFLVYQSFLTQEFVCITQILLVENIVSCIFTLKRVPFCLFVHPFRFVHARLVLYNARLRLTFLSFVLFFSHC